MPCRRVGKYTICIDERPSIIGYAAVVGKKEGEGPLCRDFDTINEDTTFGEKTWEKSESRLLKDAISRAIDKSKIAASQIDLIFAGDLLNQCISTTYGLRDIGIPLYGLYGACSTMAESISLAAVACGCGFANSCVAATSSHFCSAERQFRLPLEYGGQRPPTAQWTVTGAGAVVIAPTGEGPYITHITPGKIIDLGIKDANNMGAAMAPAAADTLSVFFTDTNTAPSDYDLIMSGDLGYSGAELTRELVQRNGFDLGPNYMDAGMLIFDQKGQDVHAGGSGCGCSASVLCSYVLNRMRASIFKKVVFVGTGALMSPTSIQQGETIPSIAHLVVLES
jgi:stage V sporulation protein AD